MYTITQLRHTLAWAKAHPQEQIRIRIQGDWDRMMTGDAWRQWFRGCLDRKINRHLPDCRGRKDTPDWDRTIRHTAYQVNTPRRVVRWVPHELRTRLAHRITTD